RVCGVHHWLSAARLLPLRSEESCVRVMNAAIWSLVTLPDGLYVVADVPFARPEKNASAIWQKNWLPITSVNGTVIVCPPQAPVSARCRVDTMVRAITSETTSIIRIASLRLTIIGFLLPINH